MLGALWCPSVFSQELLLAYEDREQYPYYATDGGLVPSLDPGVSVAMVKELENLIPDLEVRLIRLPWVECLRRMQVGAVDGVFNASYRPSRWRSGMYPMKAGRLDLSRRIMDISYSLYVREGSGVDWDGEHLSGIERPVAVAGADVIVDELEKMGLRVEESLSPEDRFERLQNGQLAAVVEHRHRGDELLRLKFGRFNKLMRLDPPFLSRPYFLMLSSQYVVEFPDRAQLIWDAVARLRKREHESLMGHY